MYLVRIGVCSWSDRSSVSDITWPLLKKYCSRHGYIFITGTEYFENDVAGSWMKLKMLQQQSGLDYLVWFDDDIIITDTTTGLEKYIEDMGDHMFGIMADSGTTKQKARFIFNMGIMAVRCGDSSLKVLNELWKKGIESRWRNKRHLEQDYITSRYNACDKFKNLIYKYPYGSIQTFIRPYGLPDSYQWKPGDFSAHITGFQFNNKSKVKRLQTFISNNLNGT